MENQKRPRDPLDENSSTSSELENVLKKRRLAAGEENLDPTKSPARTRLRLTELEVKPDTPAIVSIRSRVQQLSQRRDSDNSGGTGLIQRCVSDPGSEGSSRPLSSDICHIGDGEFSSRQQRFKPPTPLNSPGRLTPCTRNLSSFVHGIQKQLNATVTPSSKEASRIRQARVEELRKLKVPAVGENMWLKRSLSDSSLTEEELKESEFSSCEVDSKVVEESLNTTPLRNEEIPHFDLNSSAEPSALSSSALSSSALNTSALIDKMFEDVLQHADKEGEDGEKESEEEKKYNNSSGLEMEEESEPDTVESNPSSQENSEMCEENEETFDGSSAVDEVQELQPADKGEGEMEQKKDNTSVGAEEDFLTLPPRFILSPLSKSVEAVVTPMIVITAAEPSVPPVLPEEESHTADVVPPLYSIDAYRLQRKIHPPSTQNMNSEVQKQVHEKICPKQPINTKERIKTLNEEAAKLQTIITQTLQALSCCSDEEHGKGSMQEAEAEKLLLVSCEKRAALLAEVSRLREGGSGEPDSHNAPLQPCRGTISISSIQLPLKVEFVCSARTGRPMHYFFVLIRYGACNIVATPLATPADAQNGDTITFPTSITLQDIRSNFEIDIEVYSLSNNQSNTCSLNTQQFRSSTKSRVTPKKILHSITKSSQSVTSATLPGLSTQRSSNFKLVGSHKVTLSSLGQSKFPLDKIKFEGKIRRLLGDEFQEKVPFLSPLEGHIYLRLHSEGHSDVKHQGFLTMFEDVSGFGAWQRLYFCLEGGHLLYWSHPNEIGDTPSDGSFSLFGFCSVRPVKRECCARPDTFELVETNTPEQQDDQTLKKSWFSADTREERTEWMEKLNQTLLDFQTWNRKPVSNDSRASTSSMSGTSRESIL
ncbi:anillin, actin binding protein 2 isoform X2 [Triplophysa dalaica]|uniref:anillin, actin binding protein 2 isoform X2 n=1 Tax=Triplophysa dalaica TaxID=1582913 RepID=UPI0024E01F6A|nr:anillin, actin binding protein 2 isoform X2 [Triplophysa dalaica]